jgi:hypothetical protein
MFTSARHKRQTREHLDACLAELNQIRPATLLREDVLGRDLSVRMGLAYFERTLELYHRLSHCDLDLVPLARLKNIANDAENTVDQFRKILSFTGKDLQSPLEARDLLIDDVKDSFERISPNVGIVVSQLPKRHQDFARSTSAVFVVALCVLISALAVIAYYSVNDRTIADNLRNAVYGVRSP